MSRVHSVILHNIVEVVSFVLTSFNHEENREYIVVGEFHWTKMSYKTEENLTNA